jgi:hypothetical protein
MHPGGNTEQTNSTEQNDYENTSQQCECTLSTCCLTCLSALTGKVIRKRIRGSIIQLCYKSIIVRLLSSIVIFTASILWFGFALNFTRDIIFIPFSHSFNAQNFKRTAWIYAAVPGIMHFSAHYFWFLTQLAFHCYRKEEIPETEPPRSMGEKYGLLCDINRIVKVYRNATLFLVVLLPWSLPWDDPFSAIFAPIGVLSLFVYLIGHLIHIIGVFIFFLRSLSFADNIDSYYKIQNSTNDNPVLHEEKKQNENNTNDNVQVNKIENELSAFWCVPLIIVFPLLDYNSSHRLQLIWYAILFIVYRLLFMNFSIDETPNENMTLDGIISTKRLIQSFMYHSDKIKKLIALFSKSSEIVRSNQQFYKYKLFVMVVLRILLTTVNFIIKDMHCPLTVTIIYVSLYAIFIFFWVPPIFNTIHSNRIIKYQMWIIQLLLIFMFAMVIFTILFTAHITGIAITSVPDESLLIPIIRVNLLLYSSIMLVYHIYHLYRNAPVEKFYTSGVALWQEKHDKISIFVHTYNYMYMFLIVIVCVGIVFSNSLYLQQAAEHQTIMDQYVDKSGTFIFNETVDQHRLEACHWEYESLNIVDMMLFAALAYMPSERVESEIKMFYNRTDLQIKFDNRFKNFKPNGHGEVTYFTVTTPNVVLVSIRGTQLGYEWLIDFDIWIESVVNQVMSVLFPWSRLYPHDLIKSIIGAMSISPGAAILRSQYTERTKRYYVAQMINKLKEISKEYPEPRSLILVGHSLGGGLAKLAGLYLNRTKLIVSISGPGITYSHAKYVATESLNARIFNILHDRDIVPWADKQEGLIQMITCPEQYNRIQCHAILPMFCNMLQNCGNPRKFAINENICKP